MRRVSMLLNIEKAKKEAGTMFSAYFEEIPACDEFPIKYEIVKPVKVNIEYVYEGEKLLVRGNFEAYLKVNCGRCLKEFISEVTGEFAEEFAKELTDEISYQLTGDVIALDKLVLDSIAEQLPTRFLCSEDCKGLCPVCGADLNVCSCGCNKNDDKKTTSPFAKLEGLFDNT